MDYYSLMIRDKNLYLEIFNIAHQESLESENRVCMADVTERLIMKGLGIEKDENNLSK
jgi:hypothetical protein